MPNEVTENNFRQVDDNYTPSQSDKDTSARNKAIGQSIQAGGQVLGGIVGGIHQYKENQRARKEARRYSDIARKDELKKNKEDNQYRRDMMRLERDGFKLEKRRAMFKTKLDNFNYQLQKTINRRQELSERAGSIRERISNNDILKDIMLKTRFGK